VLSLNGFGKARARISWIEKSGDFSSLLFRADGGPPGPLGPPITPLASVGCDLVVAVVEHDDLDMLGAAEAAARSLERFCNLRNDVYLTGADESVQRLDDCERRAWRRFAARIRAAACEE
jgi:hypothetical protein